MSPNETSLDFNKIVFFSSSESSDSESFLLEDIKNRGSFISKQWEAIERTLYQEPGQQVTDPELLKECKLWRETFPHFRVKGTKINLKQSVGEAVETDKNVQTTKKHFNLKKLEEKSENIKKKVVGVLVERLIAKYGLEKEGSVNPEFDKSFKNGVQMSEIADEVSEKSSDFSSKNNINESVVRNLKTSSPVSTDKESYFERGKELNKETVRDEEYFSLAEAEKNLYEIFDSWEKECKDARELSKNYNSKKVDNSSPGDNIPVKGSDKPNAERFKQKKYTPPSNSLSGIAKPFETTKKIDKKYEGLIEKIIERKYNEFDIIRHCRTSASELDMISYQESLEKIRKGSGFDDYLKRKEMSKINKFNNNWLKRSEKGYYAEMSFIAKNKQSTNSCKISKSSNPNKDNDQNEIDEKFLEEFRKEMTLNCKRPPQKIGGLEEINLQRPKLFFTSATVKASKPLSCSRDLTKKNRKEVKGRPQRGGWETGKTEPNLKNHFKCKSLNGSRRNKSNAIQNSLLPPIETGIICTELTGRPKVALKNPTKRN